MAALPVPFRHHRAIRPRLGRPPGRDLRRRVEQRQRLDLNEANARAAVAAGVKLSINTDAHGTAGLAGIGYGIGVARRAWVTKAGLINCLSVAKLEAFIAAKRT